MKEKTHHKLMFVACYYRQKMRKRKDSRKLESSEEEVVLSLLHPVKNQWERERREGKDREGKRRK